MKKIYSESSGMSQRNFQNLYNGSNVSSGKSKNANPFVESTSKRCQLYIREKSSESDADLSREEIRSDIEEKECPSTHLKSLIKMANLSSHLLCNILSKQPEDSSLTLSLKLDYDGCSSS